MNPCFASNCVVSLLQPLALHALVNPNVHCLIRVTLCITNNGSLLLCQKGERGSETCPTILPRVLICIESNTRTTFYTLNTACATQCVLSVFCAVWTLMHYAVTSSERIFVRLRPSNSARV